MFKQTALAAVAAAAFYAAPAAAATVTFDATSPSPGGVIVLVPNGPNAASGFLGFDVTGTGDFEAVLTFVNPFANATAGGSAVFNFDGDSIMFTGGDISGGGTVVTNMTALGSSIQIDRLNLGTGAQTLRFRGTLTPAGAGTPGAGAARIGGQLSLLQTPAIPEPGTWAMFILGFGAVGGLLRRRAGAVRVSKAKLNFA